MKLTSLLFVNLGSAGGSCRAATTHSYPAGEQITSYPPARPAPQQRGSVAARQAPPHPSDSQLPLIAPRTGNICWATPLVVLLQLAPLCSVTSAEPPAFQWHGTPTTEFRLQEAGKDVLTFQLAPKSLQGKYSRANYIHPLFDPSGHVLTEDFPADHLHHRGVFWAWHQIRLRGQLVADQWMCQNIEWTEPATAGPNVIPSVEKSHASLRVVRDWTVRNPDLADQPTPLIRETVHLNVWPSTSELRQIDIDLTLRALAPEVSIGGSEDVKGYGGFSPRIRLADDVQFVGQTGAVQPRTTAVAGGAWMDVVGTLDGERKGMVMMVHPSHPGFPLKWILRSERSMQNPQWPGREPAALSMSEDTVLRYRLVLHVGDLTRERLQALWQAYAETN